MLRLCWFGLESKQIDRLLGISPHSVRFCLRVAFERLGVNDRHQAVLALAKLARASAPPENGRD